MTRQLILLVLILSIFDPTTAQEDGTRPIRVDNVGNLQMVDVVGRGAITDYAWSMDSFVIAVSSESGLWLYNPMDLNESPIHFDPRPFNTVAYSSDGTYLAAGATDRASQVGCTIYGVNLLSVWNLTTSEMHFEAETSIVNMMFFPKENMILAVNRQSGLEIWDVENGERLAYSRNLVPSGVSHTFGGDVILSISPDGDYFSAISYYYRDDEPYVWSTQDVIAQGDISLETVAAIPVTDNWLTQSGSSPNGEFVAGATTTQLTVWEADTHEEITTLHAHNGSVQSVAFSPQANQLAFYHYGGFIRLWDIDGSHLAHLLTPDDQFGSNMLYSPDGRFLATGTDNAARNVYIWDTTTGGKLATYSVSQEFEVFPRAFTSDSRYLFVTAPTTGSQLSSLTVIDLQDKEIEVFVEVDGVIGDLAISPNDELLAIDIRERTPSGFLSEIQIWNIEELATDRRDQTVWEFDATVDTILFVNDKTLVFEQETSRPDCLAVATLLNIDTGIQIPLVEYERDILQAISFQSLALNADRSLLAIATQQGIKLWDLSQMQELPTLDESRTLYVEFSADGASLLSIHTPTLSGEVRLWRIQPTGE